MKLIEITLGQRRFIVDGEKYSRKKIEDIYVKLTDLEAQQHPYRKFQIEYPKQEDESDEDWEKRVKEEVQKKISKQEDESELDYMYRLGKMAMQDHISMTAFKVLNVFTEVFKLDALKLEDYDEGSYPAIEAYLYDLLSLGRLPQADWFCPSKDYGQLKSGS